MPKKMQRHLLLLSTLVLTPACVQLKPPTQDDQQSWQDFGYQWAMKGYIIESRNELAKKVPDISDDNFKSYQSGYQSGKSEYCKQDPFILGHQGKIYYGICNDLDRRYAEEYWRGKNARARR
ncbi:hypothetical protein JCM19239_5648 [Vibrio variabilis]|uniref:Lipoprotein n=1 Tax=Vibrio variabilis TaxID=990271 RepID=A0ABQ0JFA0_9VIBR|nr:hypothetical protein JCM19239_5648 [Vibrio variabilis]